MPGVKICERYDEKNSVAFSEIAQDYFLMLKHFSSKEYYNEVIKNHPEYKNKIDSVPTETSIEKMITEEYGNVYISGATSVPAFEEMTGLKIAGVYKLPKDMSDIEYSFYMLQQTGIGLRTKNVWIEAWYNLHYPENERLVKYQKLYDEIIELNPALKSYKFDTKNPQKLREFLDGITFKFPIADIMYFVNKEDIFKSSGYNGTFNDWWQQRRTRQNALRKKYKIGMFWILSDETMDYLEQQLGKEKTKKFKKAMNSVKNKILGVFKTNKTYE